MLNTPSARKPFLPPPPAAAAADFPERLLLRSPRPAAPITNPFLDERRSRGYLRAQAAPSTATRGGTSSAARLPPPSPLHDRRRSLTPVQARALLGEPTHPPPLSLLGGPAYLPAPSYYRDTFEQQMKLGSGSYGDGASACDLDFNSPITVYQVRHRLDGCLYAAKQIKRRISGDASRREAYKEAHALAALGGTHANLLRYHNMWEEEGGTLYILTELCDLGSLRLDPHTENPNLPHTERQLAEMVRQLASGLQYLHAHGFVHLDVKPENVCATSAGLYKLTDFSLVARVGAASVQEGDNRYMAYELLRHSMVGIDLRKADVYSLGASIFELVRPPPLPHPLLTVDVGDARAAAQGGRFLAGLAARRHPRH